MAEYRCVVCEYVHDEKKGGEAWADLLEEWLCPVCGSPKKLYEKVVENGPDASTVIGPGAAHPLILSTPVYISHTSFGAL